MQYDLTFLMQVLIVDDNQDITGLLSRFLKAKGIENRVTNDPLDGIFPCLNLVELILSKH
jgi:DNA-binding response OmpR family regulator